MEEVLLTDNTKGIENQTKYLGLKNILFRSLVSVYNDSSTMALLIASGDERNLFPSFLKTMLIKEIVAR